MSNHFDALVTNSNSPTFVSHPDKEELEKLQKHLNDYQAIATKYGIDDIFQDNGGKVLQLISILGLKTLPGREGNDAVDGYGNQYELKTRNVSKTKYYTTNHHLNFDTISKYRKVDWIFAEYAGINLVRIYWMHPTQLSEIFDAWEAKLRNNGNLSINNPKISAKYVSENGKLLYEQINENNHKPKGPI